MLLLSVRNRASPFVPFALPRSRISSLIILVLLICKYCLSLIGSNTMTAPIRSFIVTRRIASRTVQLTNREILRRSTFLSITRGGGNDDTSSGPGRCFSTALFASSSLQGNTDLSPGLHKTVEASVVKDHYETHSSTKAMWSALEAEEAEKEKREGFQPTLYEKLVRRLYKTNLFNPVKLGLDHITRLHEAIGSPMDRENLIIIHVAGTNGKGSVCQKLAKTLELAGYKTGLFVSPHISSFRERMQINSVPISEQEVEQFMPDIFSLCETNNIPATFFEVTTGLAFAYFGAHNVDVVVLETGLGGRLDATNVIKQPSLSIITSIGLEHTKILGDTIELIAKEKAGIIKPHCPVLVGPNVPHSVIQEIAQANEAEYYISNSVINLDESNDDSANADYDVENSRIAQAAISLLQQSGKISKISNENIMEGTSIRPACRFETITCRSSEGADIEREVTVVLDVAHNPSAVRFLISKLDETYLDIPKRFVVGFSSDKDLADCGKMLLSCVSNPRQIHLVQASHPRAATIEQLLDECPALSESNFDQSDRSVSAQVNAALKLASDHDEICVVCGSVFIMSEAREAIGFEEPRDSDYISEVAGINFKNTQENFANSDPCKR